MKTYQIPVCKGGESIVTDSFFDITNPSNGEIVSRIPKMNSADVDRAVAAATAALAETDWSHNGVLRAKVMLQWADRLEENIESVARQLTLENGKLIGEAIYEVTSQVGVIRYNAGLARTVSGRSHSLGRDSFAVVAREPMGVVAVISPWNWPVTLMIRDMAPALAAGNALLVKPASQTAGVSLDVLRLLLEETDLPRGLVHPVAGSGSDAGQAIVEHPGIDMIAFTGDGSTGRSIMRDASQSLKKLSLELGGKSPMVVCDDADLDKAVPTLVSAIFTTTSGQICTAPSRLLVERGIEGELIERLKKAVSAIRIGDGFDRNSQMGPMTTRDQYEKVLSFVERGRREGRLVAGGEPLQDESLAKGNFVSPAIFTDVADDSPLNRDEIFGPVLVIKTFEGDEEAIALANDTEFGLASAVFTENVHRAWRISRAIKAGTVWVNTYNRFYPEVEVGGYKQSGIGRMAGIDGLMEFTQTKFINFDSIPPQG